MKKIIIWFSFVGVIGLFFLTFSFPVAAAPSSACNSSSSGKRVCTGAALWDCKCSVTSYGTCVGWKWVYYVGCTYGSCRSSTACAQCNSTSYPVKCSSGTRTYCLNGVKKSVDCTYGCYGTTCASCRSSDNAGCSSGKVCISNSCKTPINGVCGEAQGKTYSSAPKTSLLCSAGDWLWKDDIGSDGDYSWFCLGKDGGTDKLCTAFKTRINCQADGFQCVSSSSSCMGGSIISGLTTCNDINEILTCCKYTTCSEKGGECRYTAECAARGGNASYTMDCAMATVSCCTGGLYDDICDNDNWCRNNYGSCYTCDNVAISGTSYTYRKCMPHSSNGSCGGADGNSSCSRPSSGLCSSSGTASWSDSDGSDGYWNWSCPGSCGGGSDSCAARNVPTINGVCGESQGNTFVGQPGSDLCSSGTPSWTNGDEEADDGTYDWFCNGSCGGSNAPCFSINNIAPILDDLVLKNVSGTSVGSEEGGGVAGDEDYQGRNHICQTAFNQSRVIQWEVTAIDPQGVDDIGDILLRFRSDSGVIMTTGAIQAVNGKANFVMDTSNISDGLYHVEVQINGAGDSGHTAEWVYSGRDFKVWDCLVSVSGTFYDGSDVPVSCAVNSGYTNTIPAAANFQLIYYLGTNSPINMTINSPKFVIGDQKLSWNSPVNYQPVFIDLPGSDPTEMKINEEICVSGVSLDPKLADAYSDQPTLKVDYSTVMDQESWFSVRDGSVFSVGKVNNYVPVTCSLNQTNNSQCATAVDGLVWTKSNSSGLSSYDRVTNTSREYLNKSLEIKNYNYTYFKNNYLIKWGVGTTVAVSGDQPQLWSEINGLSGIIMVNGNLTIDENISSNDFKVVVASGDIIIDAQVNQVKAVLVAPRIIASGQSDQQLIITGSLYATNSVTLNRSFINKPDNNQTPAVRVDYDPSIIFKMPKEIAKKITQWRLE